MTLMLGYGRDDNASAFAVDDMWTVANRIIVDVYTKIVGISTVLAGLNVRRLP